MKNSRLAAFIYGIFSLVVIAFQIALAAGAPWGDYAMGRSHPGQFPPELRIAAIVQAVILALLALAVLSRAGITLPKWSITSRWVIWLWSLFQRSALY